MSEKTSRSFIPLIFLSVCFTKLLHLPLIGQKIQLTECLFLVFAPFVFLPFLKSKFSKFPEGDKDLCRVDWLTFGLLAAVFLSAAVAGLRSAWIEWFGLVYLVLLHWSVRLGGVNLGLAQKGMRWMGGAAAVTALLSLLMHHSGLEMQFGLELTDQKYLPRFGLLARAEGWTMSPNQLADILILAMCFHQAQLFYHQKKWWDGWTLLLLAGLFCTFSKLILLLLAGMILLPVFFEKRTWFKVVNTALAAGFVIFFLFNTHVLWLSKTDLSALTEHPQSYIGQTVFFENERGSLVGTTYLELKKTALRAFAQHPFFGIGGGHFIPYLTTQQEAGLYPEQLPLFDPHATVFGLLAEQGLLVFLTFCAWLFCLFALFGKIRTQVAEAWKGPAVGLALYFSIWLVNSLTMDTLNARHFWLALGVFLSIFYFKNEKGAAGSAGR